jgi:type IV pilus assembly protein PilP
MVTVASSCDDPPPPAPAPAGPAKPKAVEAAPAQDSAQNYVYVYNPLNKRDPFRNLFIQQDQTGNQKVPETTQVCTDPLCQLDLDELTLVAVISGDTNPVAMLEDRGGVGHVVRRNSRIGRMGGKVSAVLRDCIEVTSFIATPDGKMQPNRSSLCVKEAANQGPVQDLMQGKNIE